MFSEMKVEEEAEGGNNDGGRGKMDGWKGDSIKNKRSNKTSLNKKGGNTLPAGEWRFS